MKTHTSPIARLLLSLSPFNSFVLVSLGNAIKPEKSPTEALSLFPSSLKFVELISWLPYIYVLKYTAEIVHF